MKNNRGGWWMVAVKGDLVMKESADIDILCGTQELLI